MPKGETRGDNHSEGAHMILCRRLQYNKTESRESGRKSSRDSFAQVFYLLRSGIKTNFSLKESEGQLFPKEINPKF